MKKIIIILLVLVFIIIICYYIKAYQNPFNEVDLTNINCIIIESLPLNKKIIITDNEQITKFTTYFKSIKLKEKKSENIDGLAYIIYINDENNYLFSIVSNQFATKEKAYYISNQKLRDFESLIEEFDYN